MSPGDKLFPPPGSFNFSMAALAADPQALASEYRRRTAVFKFAFKDSYQKFLLHDTLDFNSMQSAAAELAGSPQGKTEISIFTYQSFCSIFAIN